MDRAQLGTIKWEKWEYLANLLNDFLDYRGIVILKARQLGVSWLVVGYCLWKCLFFQNAKILLLSQGEKEAGDLVGGGERSVPGKAKFIYNMLPDFLKPAIGTDTHTVIDFPATGGVIEALPSTEKAGRSTDATIVVADEWEYHPYCEQNYAAIKPTIDAGGQFIGILTPDKTKKDSFPKSMYRRARTGESSFKAIYLPYSLRPGRDEKWREEIGRDMPKHQLEQEYSRTEKEALETLKTIPFFDNDKLEQMLPMARMIQPIDCDISQKHKTVRVYKPPIVGRRYVMFTDPSEGKEDPHATVVKDVQTGEWVAVSHGKVTADYVAQIHDDLVRYYNNAFNTYEVNAGAGRLVAEKLDDLDTPNRASPIKADGYIKNATTHGWWTGSTLRGNYENLLEEAIRLSKIFIYYEPAITELTEYMRPEGEKPCAPQGGHDDFIIAGGGVEQLQRYLPSGMARATTGKYRI